jgi:hypothetical protein
VDDAVVSKHVPKHMVRDCVFDTKVFSPNPVLFVEVILTLVYYNAAIEGLVDP